MATYPCDAYTCPGTHGLCTPRTCAGYPLTSTPVAASMLNRSPSEVTTCTSPGSTATTRAPAGAALDAGHDHAGAPVTGSCATMRPSARWTTSCPASHPSVSVRAGALVNPPSGPISQPPPRPARPVQPWRPTVQPTGQTVGPAGGAAIGCPVAAA